MANRDVEFVAQTVLDEHSGNYRTAYYDLCARFVAVVHGVSPGYMRWPGDDPVIPSRPEPHPVDDGEWVRTALGDA